MVTKRESVLALDFGSSGIKALQLASDRGRIRIDAFSSAPLQAADDQRENGSEREYAASAALRGLLQHMNVDPKKIRHVASSLPAGQIGVKQIRTVKLSEEELRSSLIFEARKHMPVKGEVLLDFQIVSEDSEEVDVLLAVTTREAVETHNRILESAGLKAGVIDAPTLALANAVLLAGGAGAQSFAVIKIGASITHVCLCTPQRHFFSRDIAIAGRQFTEEIMRRHQCDTAVAEQYKRENGAINGGSSGAPVQQHGGLGLALASQDENKTLESLSRELQRSIRFFLKESGLRQIDATFVTGGGASDASLREQLARELRTELIEMNPFTLAGVDHKFDSAFQNEFAQAFGLGLRRMYELFPDKLKQARR